jgi:hypothetical protein
MCPIEFKEVKKSRIMTEEGLFICLNSQTEIERVVMFFSCDVTSWEGRGIWGR